MTTTLTDRYVAATLRRIPAAQHDDIEQELRASIADAVEARLDSGVEPHEAETAVLTDLGDPDRLAASLAGRPLQLIGPGLYLDWWRLLTVLLWIAPIPGAVVLAVGLLDGEPVGSAIWSGIWTTASVALQIAFWTTLVFVVLERTGHGRTTDLTGPWTVDRLPEVRERRDVSLADTVASVGLLALVVAAVFLQRSVSWFHTADGAPIPVLEPALWPGWVALFLGVIAVDAAIAIVTYARGRWTVGLAVLNTVSAVVFAVPTIWLATSDRLVNPEFLAASGGDSLTWVVPAIVATVLVVCGWDVVDGWIKALRARRV